MLAVRDPRLVSLAFNSLKKSLEGLQDVFGGFGPDEGFGAVSYTHLDVYKRQESKYRRHIGSLGDDLTVVDSKLQIDNQGELSPYGE